MSTIELFIGFLMLLAALTVPGYCLLLGFYSKKIDVLERIILGVGLSLVAEALSIVLLNKFLNIPIEFWTVFGITAFYSLLGLVKWKLKK